MASAIVARLLSWALKKRFWRQTARGAETGSISPRSHRRSCQQPADNALIADTSVSLGDRWSRQRTDLRSSVRVCGQQSSDVGLEARKRSIDCLGSHVDCHAVYEDGLIFDIRGGKHSQLGFIRASFSLKFLD